MRSQVTSAAGVRLGDVCAGLGLELVGRVADGVEPVLARVAGPGVDPGRGGVLAVLEWVPDRRGGPLPPLAPLVETCLREQAPVALAVLCPDRRVNPPEQVLALALTAGTWLLWGGPGLRAPALAADLADLVRSSQPPPVVGRGAQGVLGVLEEGVDLVGLVARVAALLDARVAVSAAGRVLADEPLGPDVAPALVADLPLTHDGSTLGRLTVAREHPLDAEETRHLGALAPVLALAAVVRVAADAHQAERPARALLVSILGEDLGAREAALRRSQRLQAFPRRRTVLLVVEPFGAPLAPAGMERLARHVEGPLLTEDPRAVMVVHEGSIVLLVDAGLGTDRLVRALRRRASLPLTVGASRVVDDPRSFAGAYRQALRAATLGRRLGRANQATAYDQLGLMRLLYQLPEHERRAFVAEVLGPLADDDRDAEALRVVLLALRATHGAIAEAARRLFIHPNTLRQRIARIETLIGPFMADADRRLTVFVALDLHLLDKDEDR